MPQKLAKYLSTSIHSKLIHQTTSAHLNTAGCKQLKKRWNDKWDKGASGSTAAFCFTMQQHNAKESRTDVSRWKSSLQESAQQISSTPDENNREGTDSRSGGSALSWGLCYLSILVDGARGQEDGRCYSWWLVYRLDRNEVIQAYKELRAVLMEPFPSAITTPLITIWFLSLPTENMFFFFFFKSTFSFKGSKLFHILF